MAIQEMCASPSRSQLIHLCSKLTMTHKGEMSIAKYFSMMRGYADEMMMTGKPLEHDNIMSYIIFRLDVEYNPMTESVSGRVTPISLSDLYAQLLSVDQLLETLKNYQVS